MIFCVYGDAILPGDDAPGVMARWCGQSSNETNFQRRDSSAARRYISSSMNERATSGGTLDSQWTRGPSFRTGSAP
jgi:hypothetical protein